MQTRDTTDLMVWIRGKQGRDKTEEKLPTWQAGALETLQLLTSATKFSNSSLDDTDALNKGNYSRNKDLNL